MPTVLIQQLKNDLVTLQVLDLEADSRLGDVKAVCRLLEAPLVDDRTQDTQLIKRERQIGHGDPLVQRKPFDCTSGANAIENQ